MEFSYWEGRPAVLTENGGAFAILDPAVGWVRVASAEVFESGRLISEAEMRAWVPAANWPPPGFAQSQKPREA